MKRQGNKIGRRMRLKLVKPSWGGRVMPELGAEMVEIDVRLVRMKGGPVKLAWSRTHVRFGGLYLCRSGFTHATGINGPRKGTTEYAFILAGDMH
jgi:hypothetical protein